MFQEILNSAHYYYAFSSWPPFIVGVSIFVVSLFIVMRERFSRVSTAFAGLSTATAAWLVCQGFMFSTTNPQIAFHWARLEHVGIAFIPSALFYFTLILVKRDLRYRFLARTAVTISCIFSYLALADGFWVSGMKTYAWGPIPQYGHLGMAFIGYCFALFAASLVLLYRAYGRFQATVQKIQLQSFFRSFAIALLAGIDVFSAYGVNVYPAGYLPVYTALLLMAQMIWRYRFADITPAFAAEEITETMPNALVVFDHRGIVCVANPSACELLGREEKELLGTPVHQIADVEEHFAPYQRLLSEGVLRHLETHIVHPSLGDREINLSVSIVRDTERHPMAFVCVAEDITERKKAERALWASETRFRKLLDSNIIGFMRVGLEGHIYEANNAFLKMLGYTPEEFKAGKLHGPAITPKEYDSVDQWMRERLIRDHLCPAIEKEYLRRDGTRIPVLVGAIMLTETRGECLCFVIDSTERRAAQEALHKAYAELENRVQERTAELTAEIARRHEAEQALSQMAITDALTGLFNRRGFLAMAEQHLKLAERDGRRSRIYYVDVDGLKGINDQYGHIEGDHAIRQAGAILRSVFRSSDVVARMGGDEFAVLAFETEDQESSKIQERLTEKLSEYNRLSGLPYRLDFSLGSSEVAAGSLAPMTQLLAQADQALYRHKKTKKSDSSLEQNRKS